MARPPFEPRPEQRQIVQVLRANGVSLKTICANIGIDTKTLRKHFKAELADGFDQVKAAVGASVVKAALGGNMFAAKYWLSTHGGPEWRVVEGRTFGGMEGAPPIPLDLNTKVTIYLPDNGRPNVVDEPAA